MQWMKKRRAKGERSMTFAHLSPFAAKLCGLKPLLVPSKGEGRGHSTGWEQPVGSGMPSGNKGGRNSAATSMEGGSGDRATGKTNWRLGGAAAH